MLPGHESGKCLAWITRRSGPDIILGMEENPYRAPIVGAPKRGSMFLRWPATVVEWVVIVIIAIVALLLFLPDLDEGRQAARKRLGKQSGFDPQQQVE